MSAPPQVEYAPEVKYDTDRKDESTSSEKDIETVGAIDPEFERKTLRRVDFKLLPLLAAVYALALIDRSNLGIARTVGMGKDLKLTVGSRYSIATLVYFPPYILLELPSNLVLRRFGPRNWLSFITVAWGIVQLGMGFVPTWGFLALTRVFLGALEAGFFPAIVFIITTWYTRYEVQKRLGAFYLMAIFVSGFSSIIAYALSLLDGKRGIAGWSWIFIVEGMITIILGILVFFFVGDFPEKNKFLTPEQTKLILRRIEEDRGDSVPDHMTGRKVLHYMADWKLWVYGLMFMTQTTPAYAVGYFINIILQGMGFSVKDSLLLAAPPYAFALFCAMTFAWASDKYRKRALFLMIQTFITIMGLGLTAYAPKGWRYAGLFFITAGSAGCIPGILAYSANNIVTQSKRGVSSAIIIAFGGVGGIFASTAFREQDYPRYIPGLWATMACQFFMLLLLAITTIHFRMKNKAVRNGTAREPIEGRPGFLYTI